MSRARHANRPPAAADLLSWLDDELPPMSSRESLALALGVALRTVDRALATGALRAVRIGRRVLIPRNAVRAWLAMGIY